MSLVGPRPPLPAEVDLYLRGAPLYPLSCEAGYQRGPWQVDCGNFITQPLEEVIRLEIDYILGTDTLEGSRYSPEDHSRGYQHRGRWLIPPTDLAFFAAP